MHLVTIRAGGRDAAGVIAGDDILVPSAAGALMPAGRLVPSDMIGLLEGGDAALDLVRKLREEALGAGAAKLSALRAAGALVPRANATLLAPVPNPGTILAAGMNSRAHQAEMNSPIPEKPVSLYKSPAAVIGTGEAIRPPAEWSGMIDFEGEFSAVFGTSCHRVKAADALSYLAGYTLVNDVSARDWVPAVFTSKGVMEPIMRWEHNILGKQFPTFCPMGPTIATRDEIADPSRVQLTTTLNGVVMQDGSMQDLIFGLPELIEYYSQFYRFRPGDVITTGSPSGVGFGRDPKLFMKAGDLIEVSVKQIGTLSNPVA
jgi:acylpyruvate hydrolase